MDPQFQGKPSQPHCVFCNVTNSNLLTKHLCVSAGAAGRKELVHVFQASQPILALCNSLWTHSIKWLTLAARTQLLRFFYVLRIGNFLIKIEH